MKQNLKKILPQLNQKIWILTFGRFLSQIGSGFTLFYAPIFFVNQIGLTPTIVGVALGSGSISGMVGRFLGGSLADSPKWGRRKTLLLSAAVSAFADVALFFTGDFTTLLIGNLLMGLGIGLYWPATEAAVADLTTGKQRNEAFAITRLADSLGLSMGVVIGGWLIAGGENYRSLFLIDGISFVIFFLVIYVAIAETYQFTAKESLGFNQGWGIALRDRRLLVFLLVSTLITTYISLIQSIIPLYFNNFLQFSAPLISAIFSWHIICMALSQLPVARWLNRFTHPRALMLSLLLWGISFILLAATSLTEFLTVTLAILALTGFSLGIVSYTPAASSLVVDLSPPALRGIYLSLNSQCWAIGYLIGPPLGGWGLDHPSLSWVSGFWLAIAATVMVGIAIVAYLERILASSAL